MGLVKEILRIACDFPGGYGAIYEFIYNEKTWQEVPSKATVSSTISRLKKKVKKTTMVLFDIPEKKRRYRDWIRRELVLADFEFVQQSVWFGPGVSKEFVQQLEEYDLLECVRFFKVKEKDLV